MVELYKYYSKKIITESSSLRESESVITFGTADKKISDIGLIKKIKSLAPKRFKTIIYYDTDSLKIPTSFQINYEYSIMFDLNQIKADFSDTKLSVDNNVDVNDDEIDKAISKKLTMKSPENKSVKTSVVNMNEFYSEVFKKLLPSYAVKHKINDLILGGILPIDDYNIFSITYSTQVTDDLLFRKIESGIKSKKPNVISSYGYEIAFKSKDIRKSKSIEDILDFALRFSVSLDESILKDTKYYKIVNKVMTNDI